MNEAFVTLHYGPHTAIISPEDAAKVAAHSWHILKKGRKRNPRFVLATRINGRRVSIHRFLTEAPIGKVVDHINNNSLDNRRENLRVCTQAENCRNQVKFQRKCSSQFKGVYLTKDKRWQAHISVNHNRIVLGYFESELEAARRYDTAALEHHGEFARPNFPQPIAA